MSLPEMQTAMAMLIRMPEHHRGDNLEAFLSGFSLSDLETKRLHSLAQDRRMTKYGRVMRETRWEKTDRALRISKHYLEPKTLERLRREVFEPVAARVRFPHLAQAFVDFLAENEDARKAIFLTSPPFVFDILRFEQAQTRFWDTLSPQKQPSVEISRLVHNAVLTLDLEHDIPALLVGFPDGDVAEFPAPEPRPLTVLMIPKIDEPGCRYFEIDAEIRDFIQRELSAPGSPGNLPATYEDLVSIGLCKKLVLEGSTK